MRVAWLSPLPPVRSGIAAYSAELLPRLAPQFVIDVYPEDRAHDFLWQARRHPYDLVVYQLGNAPCHDYMWAYMATHPGLVVLHDARLHHARARQLLQSKRADDYRREFAFDHPETNTHVAEYAVEGLGGPISYFWPMLRGVVRTARAIAVHNTWVARELREQYPEAQVDTIRMGVVAPVSAPEARRAIRAAAGFSDEAVVFATFGKVTAEKRIAEIVGALRRLVAHGHDAYLLIVGDADSYDLPSIVREHDLDERVRTVGYVDDNALGDYLAAADACLCLRWPTAQESSASWLRCLAAARPTVISDLAHLADVPDSVAVRVDLLDECASLISAMRRLAQEPDLRARLARAGHAYWQANHTIESMAEDYARVMTWAAVRPLPTRADLPAHFTDDYTSLGRGIAVQFGVDVDLFRE